MLDKASVETHLAGVREGLVADGYDLLVDDVAAGKARLRITSAPVCPALAEIGVFKQP